MKAGQSVAVVVPANNEATRIADVLISMPHYVDRVLVIDDASTDATAERAREAVCPAVVEVLQQPVKSGVGAAIVCGYLRAVELGFDVVAVMAGDGQMHPDDLETVLSPALAGDADYVKGNRLGHGEARHAMPTERWLGSMLLSALTSLATGYTICDSQCGYTAMRCDALSDVALERLWPGYGYPNDMLGLLAVSGKRVREVVVRPVYRGEASGLRPWHVGVMLALIMRSAWRRVVVSS